MWADLPFPGTKKWLLVLFHLETLAIRAFFADNSEVRTNKHTLSECKRSWDVKCAKPPGIWKQLRRPSVEVERFQTPQLRILKWRESCVKIKVWRGRIVHWIVLAAMPEHHKAGYKEPQHRLWHWAAVRYASRYTLNILHNDPMRDRDIP